MVEAMYEQSPDHFKQFRIKYKFSTWIMNPTYLALLQVQILIYTPIRLN